MKISKCMARIFRISLLFLILQSTVTFGQTVLMHQMSSIVVKVPYPGLTITVDRSLSFKSLQPGTQENTVSDTSLNAGKFILTGLYHRAPIFMSMEAPGFLKSAVDSIKFIARASYNDSSADVEDASPLKTTGEQLVTLNLQANREGWTGFAYVFLYGEVDKAKAPPGDYRGKCVVTLVF